MEVTGRTTVAGQMLITTHVRCECPRCGRINEKTITETKTIALEDVEVTLNVKSPDD